MVSDGEQSQAVLTEFVIQQETVTKVEGDMHVQMETQGAGTLGKKRCT